MLGSEGWGYMVGNMRVGLTSIGKGWELNGLRLLHVLRP